MTIATNWRRFGLAILAATLFIFAAPATSTGVTPAHAQTAAEVQAALQPYGTWRRHARWGFVWVPARRPHGWRPYTHGHWVYTEAWGWYWISDREEEDWGWVTYHYGRWAFDHRIGWFWIRGEEWAPAWVDWRRGDDLIGWSPLPPDELVDDYRDAPDFWIFVEPRYLVDANARRHVLPQTHALAALRGTKVVNRTSASVQNRAATNPGIVPAVVAAAAHTSISVYRVTPRVFERTKGVQGAVAVLPRDLSRRGNHRLGVAAQKTATVIKPAATVPKPEARGVQPPQAAAPSSQKGIEHGVVTPVKRQDGELPPQAKPHRPIAPQTPPPTMPRKRVQTSTPEPSPQTGVKPVVAPVVKPVAKPAVTPVAHPKPPAVQKRDAQKKKQQKKQAAKDDKKRDRQN